MCAARLLANTSLRLVTHGRAITDSPWPRRSARTTLDVSIGSESALSELYPNQTWEPELIID
jgi:hypothetical protein